MKECDISVDHLYKWALGEVEKGMIRELANPGSGGVRQKIHSHTQPCLESEVKQGRRGGKDHGV